MSKAIPKPKYPEPGRMCWIQWLDACERTKDCDEQGLCCAVSMGFVMRPDDSARDRYINLAYNAYDTEQYDKMVIPKNAIQRWGYDGPPEEILRVAGVKW